MIERMPLPLLGGINVHDDPAAIADGQWQRLRSLAPRKAGVVGQRQSMTFDREVIPSWWHWDARALTGSLGVASAIEDYWRWAENLRPLKFLFDPNFGELSMVCLTTEARAVVSETASGTRANVTVPEGTMLLITLPGVLTGDGAGNLPIIRCFVLGESTRAPSLLTFLGETYAFAGGNNGGRVTPSTEAGNPVDFSYVSNDFGSANTGFNPDGACVVRDRVVYFKGNSLYWSDRNEPLVVSGADEDGNNLPAQGTRDIYIGGEEIEPITAVAELSTSADGSPVQSVAAAWTKTSCYMLLGEPLETDEGGDVLGSLQINRLNIQAGCVSQASVVRTPYGTFWAGPDDVWFMPFGSLPLRVGTSIREYLEGQPAGLEWRIHAEYYDGFYRLSLFSPNQGPQMYDPCGMQLWLDLRNGAPRDASEAKWFGPQEFTQMDAPAVNGGEYFGGPPGVWCMARDTRATGDGRLYALQRYVMAGTDVMQSEIKGMSLCAFDTANGRDTSAPQATRQPYATPGTTYYVGDIFVPRPSDALVTAPIYVCTQEGPVVAEPDWFAPDAQGRVFDGVFLTWTALYFDGTNVLSGYMPNLVQSGNAIEWSALSKEYMLGDPMAEKLLDGAEIGYAAGGPTFLRYNSHAKQDSRGRVLEVDYEQLADNVANQTTGDRVWQRKLLTADPTKRFHGLSATWECSQLAGYVIVEGVNDTIQFATSGNDSTVTVPAGYYTDLTALDAAVIAAAADVGHFIESTFTVDGGAIRALFGWRSSVGSMLEVYTDSKLAELFGFSLEQGNFVDGSFGAWCFSYTSPQQQLAPDMQLSGINLRYKLFGRRPV